jgi:hypothetical protein
MLGRIPAENIAMYRSFFATCHANGVNPYDWLRTVLLRINSTALARYHTLLSHKIDINAQARAKTSIACADANQRQSAGWLPCPAAT